MLIATEPLHLLILLQLAASPIPNERNAALEWNSHFQCGRQHYQRRELSAAEECFRSALTIAEQFARSDSRRGATLSDLGLVLLLQGRISDAERANSRAVEAYRECGVERCALGIAGALYDLALVYAQQNRRFEAEKLLREALTLYNQPDGDIEGVAAVLEGLGWIELHRQRPGAAESHFSRALALIGNGEGRSRIRGSLYTSLSFALLELNRPRDATEAAQRGLAAASSGPGSRPLEIVASACALAAASLEMGDYALAERSVMRAQEMLSQIPDAEPRELGQVLYAFGKLRFFQKRFAEAAELQRRSLEILSRHFSADHPIMLRSKAHYANVLRKLKRNREAKRVEAELRATLRQTREDPGKYRISLPDLQSRR
jgi:tetratricopeptide (TPR) repeat protein